jgi:hypothetical protein
MLRSTLTAAGTALLCTASFAQQQATQPLPVTGPVREGPTFNLDTGQRVSKKRAAQLRAPITTIYNNTCTWTGGFFYQPTGDCLTFVEEGIIPGGIGDPSAAGLGATADNNVVAFQIGYCTTFAPGTVDIKIGFYDSLGGACAGGSAPTPPPLSTTATGYFPLNAGAGVNLPGSPTGGQFCWTVNLTFTNNGFCMQSDGDGVWDNVLNLDRFNWSWEMDNAIVANGSGILFAGEPSATVAHGCTYNVPCGAGTAIPGPCGHGYETADSWWVNIDGDTANDNINTGATCFTSAGFGAGTACYWFGGYVNGGLFASYWMTIGATGSCAGCNGSPTTYCTSGTTSVASGSCVAVIGLQSGTPSASNAGPAIVAATSLPGQKNGLIFIGQAQAGLPWGPNGHFLCIAAPTQRTPAGNTNGTTGQCNGALTIDLNAFIAANGVLGNTPTAGMVIDAQGWFRDPGSSKTTAMTNGLEVTLCP